MEHLTAHHESLKYTIYEGKFLRSCVSLRRFLLQSSRFGEALRRVQDNLDSRNFYAFNGQIDTKTC